MAKRINLSVSREMEETIDQFDRICEKFGHNRSQRILMLISQDVLTHADMLQCEYSAQDVHIPEFLK